MQKCDCILCENNKTHLHNGGTESAVVLTAWKQYQQYAFTSNYKRILLFRNAFKKSAFFYLEL